MYPLGNQTNVGGAGSYDSPRATVNVPMQIAKDRLTIPAALDEQNAAIVQLHQIISQLEDRLGGVLQHEPANASTQPEPPESPQILDRIMRHGRGINAATGRVADLLKRLHL